MGGLTAGISSGTGAIKKKWWVYSFWF
jgi:hypothetical protein